MTSCRSNNGEYFPVDLSAAYLMQAAERGYRTTPYPSEEIRRYIRARGGRFVLSSDSHRASTLCYGFERYRPELPGENQCAENLVAKITERGN